MAKITIRTLQKMKAEGRKFTSLTAYDATQAHWVSAAGIDVILVGDSLGNVIQGHDSTVPVTVADMVYHTAAVARGNGDSLLMADLPFMATATLESTLDASRQLMQAGAEMVKLEGARWLAPAIEQLARNGVPVCAHLGLTPQSVNKFGGYRVQGKDDAGLQLLEDADALVAAGADLLLVECIPATLAAELQKRSPVPVIGIGAGADVDAQVLVLYDMLGLNPGRTARFVRDFMADADTPQAAIALYDQAVRNGDFPQPEHQF
ncbi:3-methyl-2-oxobutanoate hydroxymethyltransferase [Natronospirillum operosum]|uniref:3-methyl-2-oxobutanoate hydroxymethyltransferase n=1 Tax=Natronospirillum operosum TaxID=2759953 RepID=A0A4Z0W948_9GAMM|nr:3-methyl-2-oxobutanoate hydroxymethyltransferase [Natronospirillum operosum]TGG94107.1 3-methyl-2-oxobutanoate hydroxymethyltransferase [Natronospirillum operosum]